jgi:hypothetical protein
MNEFLQAYEALTKKHKITNAAAAGAVVQHASQQREDTKRALLIAINYFGQSGELRGCHNDIANMEAYLRKCGYTHFTILRDEKSDPKNLSATAPTRKNILAAMRSFIAEARSGMELYIHYSGHGSYLRDENGDEIDGKDECICPVDYDGGAPDNGFIRDDDMSSILLKGLPEGVKLRVCFDSCHSGSALDLPFRWVSNTRMVTENNTVISRDVVFISGCMDSQTSADSSFGGQAAGAMTWALLESLYDIQKSGKHSKTWTWKELVQSMRMKLRTGQYDQIPQLGLSAASRAGEYVDLL